MKIFPLQNSCGPFRYSLIGGCITFVLSAIVYASTPNLGDKLQAYLSDLEQLENQVENQSIEPTYLKSQVLASTIAENLESLSDVEYEMVVNNMKGYIIHREELIIVQPDIPFWKDLAKRKGKQADVDFFDLVGQLKPHGVWPAYTKRQTDFSGCTVYGNGTLTNLYKTWRDFQANHPESYAIRVKAILSNIEGKFTENTCACGSAPEVTKEFQLFVDTFPDSPLVAVLKARIAEINAKKTSIRFDCLSG
jgi:hypothetical protein